MEDEGEMKVKGVNERLKRNGVKEMGEELGGGMRWRNRDRVHFRLGRDEYGPLWANLRCKRDVLDLRGLVRDLRGQFEV